MQDKKMENQSSLLIRNKQHNEGFNLIEMAAALTIMGTCLAYAMPVILYSKINNSKSEVRTGALIVSQKIFDDIRGRNFSEIPQTDTSVSITPESPTPVAERSKAQALGRNYNVTIRYCEVATECTTNYKTFKITIKDPRGNQSSEQSIIYEMQAAFTDFK
jgi:prepilin-type N-terminal cleavage/methylation domain-containing protein